MKLYAKGYKTVAISSLLLLLALFIDCEIIAFILFFLTLYFILLYRKSDRLSPYFQPYSIVSPVDGIVQSIEEQKKDDELYLVVTIKSALFTHQGLLYAPFDATDVRCNHIKGAQLQASSALAEFLNERIEVTMHYEEFTLFMTHTTFTTLVPMSCSANLQSLSQSEIYGFMGSGLTALYFPITARVDVQVGSMLFGSETLMGYLK